jgi:hypothetical protein
VKKILLFIVFAMLPVSMFAGSITITYVSDGSVTINAPGIIANPLTTTADVFTLSPLTKEAYCVDLSHYVGQGQVDTYTTDAISNWGGVTGGYPQYTAAGHAAAWLANMYFKSGNLDKEAGLQVAIWEVLYENQLTFNAAVAGTGGFSLGGGNIYFTVGKAAVASNATNYLNALNAALKGNATAVNGYDAIWVKTSNLTANYTQDFVYVPEPSLIFLLGIGLGTVSLVGYRFKKS